MSSRIASRLTYANIVATLALVFAMSGGAYAAGRYLITSTKQINPKVLKTLKGTNGKNGPAGSAGAQGSTGPAGAAGAKGEPGAAGATGSEGKPGASVTSKEFTGEKGGCKEGGSEFTAAEGKKTTACNGKEGSPWTAGGTLPSGKTEEGQWSYVDANSTAGAKMTAISFGIPLATAPTAHLIGPEEGEKEPKQAQAITEGKCKGTVKNPEAETGNLCVFALAQVGAENHVGFFDAEDGEAEVSGKTGTLISFVAKTGEVLVLGTWAVTGD